MAQDSSLPLVRTVVVSDLHLGSRSEGDVLRRRVARDKLLERIEGTDRLVPLGDPIEPRQGPPPGAMADPPPGPAGLGAAPGRGGDLGRAPRQPHPAPVA